MEIAVKMGKLGIGPEVLDAWLCDDLNPHLLEQFFSVPEDLLFLVTVMKSIGENVQHIPCSYRVVEDELPLLPRVMEMVKRMHDEGVMHNDLHCGNVIVSYSTPDGFLKQEAPLRVAIIDWNTATQPEDGRPLSWIDRVKYSQFIQSPSNEYPELQYPSKRVPPRTTGA